MCKEHGIYHHADCRSCVEEEIACVVKVNRNLGIGKERVLKGIIAKTQKYPRKTPALKAAQDLKIAVCESMIAA